MEEEQHHWDDRRRIPDGGYPHGPPGPLGLLGVRPGMPPQPQGPAVSCFFYLKSKRLKSWCYTYYLLYLLESKTTSNLQRLSLPP